MHEKGQPHQEFRDLIVELVLLFKPKTYCEVGVQKGYVYNAVAPLVKRAIAVDIIPFRGIYKKGNSIHYQMDSSMFANKWLTKEDPSIDMLFIDADHSSKKLMEDFRNLSVFVPHQTGLILLHDTYPINKRLLDKRYCSDAWKVAKEIHKFRSTMYEIVTLPGPRAGLSIIRKAITHGWMDT